MKYGVYADINNSVPSSMSSTGRTCLLYLGNCPAPDSDIHYITSWADAQSYLNIRPQTDVIVGDACFVCLDMIKIPFYAVRTLPQSEFIEEVCQNVADFVASTDYDSYIICIVRMKIGEITTFWGRLGELITKPVFYIGDYSENPLDRETQYVLENGRPDIEKLLEVAGTLPQDSRHELSFGAFKHPNRAYPVALSALRAALLAQNDVIYKSPVRVDGNIVFEAESLQAKRFDPTSYIPLLMTKADADTLAENCINTAVQINGQFRTWGDMTTDGTFINVARMGDFLTNWFNNHYLNKTPLTLCDRDTIIRDVSAYLDSLIALGALSYGSIEWVEHSGVWQFDLALVNPRPTRALTAQVRHGDIVINYL